MRIELISEEQFNFLKQVQENHEILTFQNVGYQYIDKSKFTEEDQEAFDAVQSILKEHIKGFSTFNNFCHNKAGDLRLRFQYDYGYDGNGVHFVGVGYILLDELLNGFKEK